MAKPGTPTQPKRTLTPGHFVRTVANVAVSCPVLLSALIRPKTSAALREKVVLAVTSITDCRYCQWGHTHWALANGVPLEEVNEILGHDLASLQARNPAEAAAILFARHYAENLDRIDPASLENLRRHYTDAQVRGDPRLRARHHAGQPGRQQPGRRARSPRDRLTAAAVDANPGRGGRP